MYRNYEHQKGYDNCPANRLNRVKTHCCPGSWRAALMMNRMSELKPAAQVKQSVGPIEPGVMQEQIDQKRNWQIPKRIQTNIHVNLCPTRILPAPCDNTGRNSVDRCGIKRPANFTRHLGLELVILPRVGALRQPGEKTAGNQIAHTDNQCHRYSRDNYRRQVSHIRTLCRKRAPDKDKAVYFLTCFGTGFPAPSPSATAFLWQQEKILIWQ